MDKFNSFNFGSFTVIPIKYVRIFLGLLFVLFLPGYIFIAALFPKKEDLDSIESSIKFWT